MAEVVTMAERLARLANEYDVVVVGGGPAGLSGALVLARARRSVVVIDAGAPRNAPADGVHGLLARDGMSPAELLATGRSEVRRFGGHVVTGEVEAVTNDDDDGFAVTLADGRCARASTAGHDRTGGRAAGRAGSARTVGRDVVHCPYCHGWEVRDQAIGVLATGPLAVHMALLFRQWSADVVLFTHTTTPPSHDEAEQLAARGIGVVPGEVERLEIADDRLVGVRLRDGDVIARHVLVASPHMRARSGVLATLGLTPVAHPRGVGEYVATTDPTGQTEVPGVWVAGNVADLTAQVGGAAAAGALAAAAINNDLITEDTRRAVDAYRNPFSAAAEARMCESVTGDRRHGL
ncbi:MAG TPA: NAD(P)/FAD-dependent oxidoreductase [Pseudonocardiaceae bacterium]|nr:NAD(P)/FAD-dependent oxidoreductase [Pseudonocardiaceae bacterium]